MTFCHGQNLRLAHGPKKALSIQPFDVAFPSGKLTALVGRNGSGKTTFLRAILGERVLASGEIHLEGLSRPTTSCSPRELSKAVAIVPQEHRFPSELRLVDLLRLAYLPSLGLLGRMPDENTPEIQKVLQAFGLEHLARRSLHAISTGERQKAFLARALLQKPKVLLLDEPTNHLDPGAIFDFWETLTKMRTAIPFEVVVATHDLPFVKRYAQWVCALETGNPCFQGEPEAFFTRGIPSRLFGGTL